MHKSILLISLLAAPALAQAGDPVSPTSPTAPTVPAPGTPAPTAPPTDPRTPVASLPWTRPYGPQGPEFAYVQGDPKTGAYQAFLRMPTGAVAGWHTHDAAYRGVVVQGTHQHVLQGESSAVNLGPGSTWLEPGGRNHDDRCIEGPCVIYLVSEGPQTYHPKTADGNDPPPPAPPPTTPEPSGKKKKN